MLRGNKESESERMEGEGTVYRRYYQRFLISDFSVTAERRRCCRGKAWEEDFGQLQNIWGSFDRVIRWFHVLGGFLRSRKYNSWELESVLRVDIINASSSLEIINNGTMMKMNEIETGKLNVIDYSSRPTGRYFLTRTTRLRCCWCVLMIVIIYCSIDLNPIRYESTM